MRLLTWIATLIFISLPSVAFAQIDPDILAMADRGDAEAQYNLGVIYTNGEGVPSNDIKAYAWMSMAAAQGYEIASENKSNVAEAMTRGQITEAQAYAARCFENDYKGCD